MINEGEKLEDPDDGILEYYLKKFWPFTFAWALATGVVCNHQLSHHQWWQAALSFAFLAILVHEANEGFKKWRYKRGRRTS